MGGDDAGAVALGRYADALSAYGDDVDMFYVINQRRYLTATPDETVSLMYEIENASRMKHTAIVNNTNLGKETTLEIIEGSEEFASEISVKTGLPIVFTTFPEEFAELTENPDAYPVKVYVKPIWEI